MSRGSEEARDAPHPEQAEGQQDKPDSRAEVKAATWKYTARKSLGEFTRD